MDPILEAESIVATLGIPRALEDNPKAPTEANIKTAARMPNVIAKRVREILNAKKPVDSTTSPDVPEFRKAHPMLIDGINGDELAEMLLTVPPTLQPACASIWSKSVAYLNSVFPRHTQDTMTGPRLYDPSVGEWTEFGWAWRIADNPLAVLDLIAAGMLIGAEVAHLKTMFPTLFATICGEVQDALAEHAAEDDQWLPPWWLQKQLCTLFGVSPVSKTLLADIEGAVQASKQQTAARAHDIQMKSNMATPSQQLEAK